MNSTTPSPSTKTAATPAVASGTARAIDAGFGVMKFTRKATAEEALIAVNGVVNDSFLSVAIDAADKQANVAGSAKRDTVLVEYDGRSYEAGKGVHHTMVASDFGRDMTDSYYDSPVYHALMRAALAYMGDEEISTLVLGLPMNHFENKLRVEKLQSQYTGEIDLGHGRTVNVGRAIVHPQPFGGYISLGGDIKGINEALKKYPNCGIEPIKSADDLARLNILIVDPGEYTLDWLLMTPAGPADRVSSAASDAGRHRIVREIHKLISEKLGRPLGTSFFTDIDEALRAGKNMKLRVAGQVFDLAGNEFQKAIEFAVEDPVRQLFAGLRGAEDRVDLVAVFGGSPVEVAAALRKSRPNLPVYCPSEATGQNASLFANLRGFQEWAEEVDAKAAQEAIAA